MKARPPANNEERLAALARYQILDTPVEPDFEAITALAAKICEVPVSQITFVDRDRQWFKSIVGIDVREMPLDVSACAHAILETDFMIVPDMREDPRFADNPLVAGEPYARFYAGALLETPDGYPLGTVCVLDFQPRVLTEAQQDLLKLLARQVMNLMELRRQYELQREAQARLEAELALRQEILGMVTHDLRSPLSVVKMVGGLAAECKSAGGGAADSPLVLMSGHLQDAVGDMERLIDDLTDFSIIEQGQLSMNFELCDVREILENIERRFALKTGEAGISLVWTDGMEEPAPLVCDPGRLSQALGNLVSNAIKFTPRGGKITLALRRTAHELELTVSDTGKGIAPEKLHRIFERFWTENENGEGGRGLGLTIVQSIVAAHGGHISASSEWGRGSLFLISLPLTNATVA
jgi:signal transduction histidine kinase